MKHLKYASYIVRHKWFVAVAGRRVGASLWLLLIHDLSKLRPREWRPYATYFYAPKPRMAFGDERFQKSSLSPSEYNEALKQRREAFERAWLFHQHSNPHHWQHWLLQEDDGDHKSLPMPEKYVREMVADWMGAGRAITGRWDVAGWYEQNREKIVIDYATRNLVEDLIARVSVSA